MTARRPLLTAAAAGSLLCGLWFVPSANATVDPGNRVAPAQQTRPQSGSPAQPSDDGSSAHSGQGSRGPSLAQTGSVDVTPYLVGGTAFLGLGVAMVTASVRRGLPGRRPSTDPA